MQYAKVIYEENGRKKSYRLELLSSKYQIFPLTGKEVLVVTGYKVNKAGEYVSSAVDELQVIIGSELSIEELEEDWKYGELVPAGTASQHEVISCKSCEAECLKSEAYRRDKIQE